MNIYYSVPFFSNTSDDTHCFQACFRMLLKYYLPDQEYSWQELDKITAKVEGLWTWPLAGMLWLQKKGITIEDVEVFDLHEFVKKGEEYLIDFFGEEVGTQQIQHSDIKQERLYAKEVLEKFKIEKRIPNIEDIVKYLNKGYLIGCNVNSNALNNKNGYTGHFVLIIGCENDSFVIHDPGLPPLSNRKVSFEQFEKAWAYPNEKAKGIMAFRLNKNQL